MFPLPEKLDACKRGIIETIKRILQQNLPKYSYDEFYASLSNHANPKRARSHFWDQIKNERFELGPVDGQMWPCSQKLIEEIGTLFVVNLEKLTLAQIFERIKNPSWELSKIPDFEPKMFPLPEKLDVCKRGIIETIKTVLSNHVKVEFQGGGSYQKYIKYKTKYLNLKNKFN
jgi:hypothetical protein